jgi:DNA-binding CsgD family transcriptional regulator
VARGKSNSDIATIMGVSAHTVDAYLRRVFLKLGTTDRVTAAIRGAGSGLITGVI